MATIVNSNGNALYSGNPKNPKFIRLLAESGNTQVEGGNKFDKGMVQDGKIVERPDSPMEAWMKSIRETDLGMPRYFEDLITDNPSLTIHENIKTRYDEKVALRATKP